MKLQQQHHYTSLHPTIGQSIKFMEKNYVNEAKAVIFANEEITIENALKLNHQFKFNLQILKTKLESLQTQCREKYAKNEQLLSELNENPRKSFFKINRQYSYFFCGAPFFKDKNSIAVQPNPDYLYRKNVRHEFFPMDLNRLQMHWVAKDKIFLIQGVKEQLIKTLISLEKDEARKNSNCKTISEKAAQLKSSEMLDNCKMLERQPITELYKMLNGRSFTIDWFTISAKDLDDRHSPNECTAIWNGYLNPILNRKPWTSNEDQQLLEAATAFNQQDWSSIAKRLNGRSDYQCLVQYKNVLVDRNKYKNVKWTSAEDKLLLQTIEKYRIGSLIPWSSIVEKMPGRTKPQVYNRYNWTLKPDIKKDKFTVEEDCILMAAVKEHGVNFQKFPIYLLPGRTIVQIRNRYNNVLKHVGKNKSWSSDDDEKLMELIDKYGTTDWKGISSELSTHTRFSCRSRFCTIMRFLQKNPSATFRDVPRKNKPFSTNVTEENWMETIISVKEQACHNNDNMLENTKKRGKIRGITAAAKKRPNKTKTKKNMNKNKAPSLNEFDNDKMKKIPPMRTFNNKKKLSNNQASLTNTANVIGKKPMTKTTLTKNIKSILIDLPDTSITHNTSDIDKHTKLSAQNTSSTVDHIIKDEQITLDATMNNDNEINQSYTISRVPNDSNIIFIIKNESDSDNNEVANFAKQKVQNKHQKRIEQSENLLLKNYQLEKHVAPNNLIIENNSNFNNKSCKMQKNLNEQKKMENKLNVSNDRKLSKKQKPTIKLAYYQYLKYSYDFRFETLCQPDKETNDTCLTICQSLCNEMCPKDFKILTVFDGVQMDMEQRIYTDQSNFNHLLPVSYCTALLLRGLTIMFPLPCTRKWTPMPSNDKNLIEHNDPIFSVWLDLLKKRLVRLLYCTALASKLKLPSHRYDLCETALATSDDGSCSLPPHPGAVNVPNINDDMTNDCFIMDICKTEETNADQLMLDDYCISNSCTNDKIEYKNNSNLHGGNDTQCQQVGIRESRKRIAATTTTTDQNNPLTKKSKFH